MTEQQDKHPKRCETCANYKIGKYTDTCRGELFPDNMDSAERQYIHDWIETHGCASHSSGFIAMEEKDDVHWITGQELREIYSDDLSLDKYDEIRKRPATPVKEQIVAAEKRGYERALDDLGVLHGEDARKFNEELENPSPLTPEAVEVMRKARELANDRTNPTRFPTPLCQKCPIYLVGRGCIHELKYEGRGLCDTGISAIVLATRKEMAKAISEILDHEWMCSLNEIKYILDCVANGNADPFKDRPEKGVEK